MSILIKDMEMPRHCGLCPLSHWNQLDILTGCELHNRYVPKSDKEFWEKDRPNWCPLIEVPDVHGRLIDGDALADKMIIADEPQTVSEHINNIVQFMRSLADAPTVIPSNKEEET